MAVKAQGQEPESPVEWLENELRETKARLHKVEGELEQALKQVWSMEAGVKKLTEASSSSGSASATLAGLREDVRQLARADGEDAGPANSPRQPHRRGAPPATDGDQPRPPGAQRALAASRLVDQEHRALRDQGAGDRRSVAPRRRKRSAGVRLTDQSLERQMEEISTRTGRAHEATLRIEQDVARVGPEIEKLAKVDDAQTERLQVMQEQVRRLAERIDKLESISAFPEEARELLQRATFEREQLAQRILLIERLSSEVTERLQEFLQSVARLDQRSQTQAAELLALSGELNEIADYTKSQLKRIFQVILRQRRRQHEALGQEIKELSQGEVQGGD